MWSITHAFLVPLDLTWPFTFIFFTLKEKRGRINVYAPVLHPLNSPFSVLPQKRVLLSLFSVDTQSETGCCLYVCYYEDVISELISIASFIFYFKYKLQNVFTHYIHSFHHIPSVLFNSTKTQVCLLRIVHILLSELFLLVQWRP